MRRLHLAYIAMLLPSCALAQETPVAIQQTADGLQTVQNDLHVGTLEDLTNNFMAQMLQFSSTGNLTQHGANIVNNITFRGDLSEVVQRFNGTQAITNTLDFAAGDVHGALSQSGSNLAGSVVSGTLNYADQLFGADARQLILNDAEMAILYGSVSQYGNNTANYAAAEHAIGTAVQEIQLGAVQRVDNRLQLAAMSTISAAIQQYGANYGNIMESNTVDSVTRTFAGDQIVHNVVNLTDSDHGPITQQGVNIANYVASSQIGSIVQVSTGRQFVTNEVFDANGQLMSGGNIIQTSDNVVNMVVLTPPAGGNDNAVIMVDQNSDFPQSSSGGGGSNSQTGNAAVVNR